jgi:hypothetical protein
MMLTSFLRLSCRQFDVKRVGCLCAGILLVAVGGCGGDDRVKLYPATGSVMVKGQPAEGVEVVLFPVDESLRGAGKPLPTGTTGPDGKFSLTSYEPRDGAPAGEYQVTIVWPEEGKIDPNNPETPPARDRLGDRYAAPGQSGLTATIDAGPTELKPFELP